MDPRAVLVGRAAAWPVRARPAVLARRLARGNPAARPGARAGIQSLVPARGREGACLLLEIRPYRTEEEASWLATWGQVVVTSHAWGLPAYQAKPSYDRPALELVLADDEAGLIAGFFDVEIENEPGELGLLRDSRCGFVWEFGLLPRFRGQGFGRKLVDHAAGWLTARGIRRMEFWSMDERAQAFYEHIGAKECNRHYRFWARPAPSEAAHGSAGFLPGANVELVHATCKVTDWPMIRDASILPGSLRVVEKPPLEPHLCRGFDYRF